MIILNIVLSLKKIKNVKKMYQVVEIKVKLNNLSMGPKDVEETDDWDNPGDIIYF